MQPNTVRYSVVREQSGATSLATLCKHNLVAGLHEDHGKCQSDGSQWERYQIDLFRAHPISSKYQDILTTTREVILAPAKKSIVKSKRGQLLPFPQESQCSNAGRQNMCTLLWRSNECVYTTILISRDGRMAQAITILFVFSTHESLINAFLKAQTLDIQSTVLLHA